MNIVQQFIGWISGAISSALNEFFNWFMGVMTSVFDKVVETLSGMVKWVWENASKAFETVILKPATTALKSAVAFTTRKMKGTLYIAIIMPLMLKEVREMIEWRSLRDIGTGMLKLLLKPIVGRIAVELLWGLLPAALPTPAVLEPPTVEPVPPAPPEFYAPPPVSRAVTASALDDVRSISSATVIAGVIHEIGERIKALSTGEIVPPATVRLSDVVHGAPTGSVSGPVTVRLSDAVHGAPTGAVEEEQKRISIAESVSGSSSLGSSSGVNPFRQIWFYRYYDTSIRRLYWDFFTSGEVQSFFNSATKPSWIDNCAVFDGVTAYREEVRLAYAVTVCLKPEISSISQETELLYIGIDNGISALRGAVLKAVNAQTLRLYDRGGLSYTEFAWSGDWIVIHIPFESRMAYVYDRDGNLLASKSLEDYLTSGVPEYTVIGSSPSSNVKLYIDWVTVSVP